MVDGGHVFPMSFVGVYSPLTGPILEGPPAHNCYFKPRISSTPGLGPRPARRDFPIRPYLHAHISRMTAVQATPSNYYYSYHYHYYCHYQIMVIMTIITIMTIMTIMIIMEIMMIIISPNNSLIAP